RSIPIPPNVVDTLRSDRAILEVATLALFRGVVWRRLRLDAFQQTGRQAVDASDEARQGPELLIVIERAVGGHGRVPDAVLNDPRSEEHTSELQSLRHLVCRLLLEKKKKKHQKRK